MKLINIIIHNGVITENNSILIKMLKLLTLNRLVSLLDESLIGKIGSKMLRVLYKNANQCLNKCDLLSAQITGNHP